MTEYVSNLTLDQTVKMLRQAGRVAVTTHAKPDGDAFGAAVALASVLRHLHVRTDVWLMPPIPAAVKTLHGAAIVTSVEGRQIPADIDEIDLIVIVDTGAYAQIEPLQAAIAARLKRVLIIDHHLSGDIEAAYRYIDSEAASCCEIIAQIGDLLIPVNDHDAGMLADPIIAESLFVGIASDTGWFKFSNTRPFTHHLAARLLAAGVDQADLFQRMEQTERVAKVKLLARALASMTLAADDRAAIMTLTEQDFHDTGGLLEETERLIDVPQMAAEIEAVALITHPPHEAGGNDTVRVSLRSKPGPNAVNVADVAAQFQGGGHARAAGAKVPGGDPHEVAKAITEALVLAIDAAASATIAD